MSLWTELDEIVGHYRRYEINDIKKSVILWIRNSCFTLCRFSWLLCIIINEIFGYNSNSGIGSVNSLKFYDKWLFPISKILDIIGFKYLFGKNLILVARKI